MFESTGIDFLALPLLVEHRLQVYAISAHHHLPVLREALALAKHGAAAAALVCLRKPGHAVAPLHLDLGKPVGAADRALERDAQVGHIQSFDGMKEFWYCSDIQYRP